MDPMLLYKIEQFAALAVKAGWEWCGVQEAIPPTLPVLVIQKRLVGRRIPFDPNDFDPIKTATLALTPLEKNMTLKEKLHKIYEAVDFIPKNGWNSAQKYKFMKSADVTRALREQLTIQKVYAEINYEFVGVAYTVAREKAPNAPFTAVNVKCTIIFHDLESPDTLTASGLGSGCDTNDKASYKAQTGALKYALKNAFLVPDEADPEVDETVDENAPAPYAEAYIHPASPTDMPDFQEAQHAAPKAQRPPQPVEAPLPPPPPDVPVAQQNQGPAVAPEHGDAYEGPDDDGSLPTEAELTEYRAKFKALGDDLSAKGKLKSSQGLPINRKLLVFFLSITKAAEAKVVTKTQWHNFFERVDIATANPEVGLVGLAALVNKANGLEPKK
jgi:hypothetical protein